MDYLKANNRYDYGQDERRCEHCDKLCKNSRGAKIHQERCQFAPDSQNFVGTVADREAREAQREELQKAKPKVECEGAKLDNVHYFKYLGSVFTSNGNHMRDVRIRSAIVKSR